MSLFLILVDDLRFLVEIFNIEVWVHGLMIKLVLIMARMLMLDAQSCLQLGHHVSVFSLLSLIKRPVFIEPLSELFQDQVCPFELTFGLVICVHGILLALGVFQLQDILVLFHNLILQNFTLSSQSINLRPQIPILTRSLSFPLLSHFDPKLIRHHIHLLLASLHASNGRRVHAFLLNDLALELVFDKVDVV